jgi:hypothetical protein
VNERWIWKFKWRRKIFIWEEALYSELVETIALVPVTKADDSLSFKLGDEFLVSSLYIYSYKKLPPPSHVGLNSTDIIAKGKTWMPTYKEKLGARRGCFGRADCWLYVMWGG